MIEKGSIVLVRASVYNKRPSAFQRRYTTWENKPVMILRPKESKREPAEGRWYREIPLLRVEHEPSFLAMVVGNSHRLVYNQYTYEFSPGDIENVVSKACVMVEPLENHRFVELIPCLEEDVEVVAQPNYSYIHSVV